MPSQPSSHELTVSTPSDQDLPSPTSPPAGLKASRSPGSGSASSSNSGSASASSLSSARNNSRSRKRPVDTTQQLRFLTHIHCTGCRALGGDVCKQLFWREITDGWINDLTKIALFGPLFAVWNILIERRGTCGGFVVLFRFWESISSAKRCILSFKLFPSLFIGFFDSTLSIALHGGERGKTIDRI